MRTIQRPIHLPCAVLLTGCLIASAMSAKADNVTTFNRDWSGTQQDFDVSVDGSGSMNFTGSGIVSGLPFIVDPDPQTTNTVSPIGGPIVASTDPTSGTLGDTEIDIRTQGDGNGDFLVTTADYTIWANNFGGPGGSDSVGDYTGGGGVTTADYTVWANNFGEGPKLDDVRNLKVELLNGSPVNWTYETMNASVLVAGVVPGTIDNVVETELTELRFEQSGAATITNPATGAFSMPGNYVMLVNGTLKTLGLTTSSLDNEVISVPVTLTGTVTFTPAGTPQIQIDVDDLVLALPLDEEGPVDVDAQPAFGFTGTVGLHLTTEVTVGFHLEDALGPGPLAVPEPGSIALLGIGLIAAIPVMRRRLRTSRR